MTTPAYFLRFVILSLLTFGLLATAQADSHRDTPTDQAPASARSAEAENSDPLVTLSAGPVNNGWQAQLELRSLPDRLRVKFNGKTVNNLFKTLRTGQQTVWLAPDNGLRYGRNVIKVTAIRQGRFYPTQTVTFSVSRGQPLASAGPDKRGVPFATVSMDARRTVSHSPVDQVEWHVIRAPAGSKSALDTPLKLRPSFTPDQPGTYQLELTVRNRQGAIGSDIMTLLVQPNFPPIGVGIETLAVQPNGDHAIVVGANCTAELYGCPNQKAVYAFNSSAVQLLILDRTTLEPLFQTTYAGTAADAQKALAEVKKTRYAGDDEVYSTIVILASPFTTNVVVPPAPIDPSFSQVLQQFLSEPESGEIVNNIRLGGWSAIGVRSPNQQSVPPGPTGHVNPGKIELLPFEEPGNLKGFFQFNPASSPLDGNAYSFTTGDYASYNTSFSRTSNSNTMRINGVDYPSPPEKLVSWNNQPCVGGFQLVVLRADTLSPPVAPMTVAENQTIGTNCGDDNLDTQDLTILGKWLSGAFANPLGGNGALVFLQSIGTPISNSASVQQYAAHWISPLIEQLGGYAASFNQSWVAPNPLPPDYIPGYALAGSTALLADAPKQAPPGIYAPEASAAAVAVELGNGGPVFLSGLLKRNYRWNFAPENGGALTPNLVTQNGVELDTSDPGFLTEVVYNTTSAWNSGNTPGQQAILKWFSNRLGLVYSSNSSCYIPAYPNVRAEYCDTNPTKGWTNITTSIKNATWSDAKAYCATNNQCDKSDFSLVQQNLLAEIPMVNYVTSGIENLQSIYGSEENSGLVNIAGDTQSVVDAIKKYNSSVDSAQIGGFFSNFAAAMLSGFAAVVSATQPELAAALGVAAALGSVTGDLLTAPDGTNDMAQIDKIKTTGATLGSALSSRYSAASGTLGIYADVILSDFGKLSRFNGNTMFQNSFSSQTETDLKAYLKLSSQRFAYGRLLSSVYQSYGLLPDNQGVTVLTDPSQYECYITQYDVPKPFKTAESGSWISLALAQYIPPYLPYNASPDLLVLAYPNDNNWNMAAVPGTIMQTVTGQTYQNGLAEWPYWFFRRNFEQVTYHCDG